MADLEKYKGIAGDTFKAKLANLFQTFALGALKDFSEDEAGKFLENLMSWSVTKNLALRYKAKLIKPLEQKSLQTRTLVTKPVGPSKLAAKKIIITPEKAKEPVPEVKEIKVAKKEKIQSFENVLDLAKKKIASERMEPLIKIMDEKHIRLEDLEKLSKLY